MNWSQALVSRRLCAGIAGQRNCQSPLSGESLERALGQGGDAAQVKDSKFDCATGRGFLGRYRGRGSRHGAPMVAAVPNRTRGGLQCAQTPTGASRAHYHIIHMYGIEARRKGLRSFLVHSSSGDHDGWSSWARIGRERTLGCGGGDSSAARRNLCITTRSVVPRGTAVPAVIHVSRREAS